jgi:intracellular multiplication protein IcmL
MSEEDELELKKLRTNFYQTNYQLMVSVLLLMLLVSFILSGIMFYNIVTCPEPTYYASSQSGNITRIHPLSDPIMSDNEISQWSKNIASIVYTFNFVNYNDVLQQLQKYFTPEGLTRFKNNFQNDAIIGPIIAKKIVVSSTINGPITIFEQGVKKGKYLWKVQIPMLITYQSPVETTQQPINLIMLITRTSTIDIAIADLLAINLPLPKETK